MTKIVNINYNGDVLKIIRQRVVQFAVLVVVVLSVFSLFLKISAPSYTESRINYKNAEDIRREEIYRTINDPELNKTQKGRDYLFAYKFLNCKIIGEACTNDPNDAEKYHANSFSGKLTSVFVAPYANPPASGVYYAHEKLQNTGFIPKSYAAEGIGFAATKPLSKLWESMRNMTYLLIVMAMVIVGFLIMFRFKINPQTIITVENSLPRLVVTLIMITFSFAISGFMIDLLYIVILIVTHALANADPSSGISSAIQSKFLTPGVGAIWDFMFPPRAGFWKNIPILGDMGLMMDVGAALWHVMPDWIGGLIRLLLGVPVMYWLAKHSFFDEQSLGIAKIITNFLKNTEAFGFALGWAPAAGLELIIKIILVPIVVFLGLLLGPSMVIGFIVFLTILFLFFRLFFLFTTSYIKILLFIIFAPLLILPNVLPGNNAFVRWIRGIAAELSVFITAMVFMVVGRIFVNIFENDSVNNLWRAPFLHSIDGKEFGLLLGMAIIFLIPEFAGYVRSAIKGSKGLPFKVGPALFFGGLGGVAGGGLRTLGGFGSIQHGIMGVERLGQLVGLLPKGERTK